MKKLLEINKTQAIFGIVGSLALSIATIFYLIKINAIATQTLASQIIFLMFTLGLITCGYFIAVWELIQEVKRK